MSLCGVEYFAIHWKFPRNFFQEAAVSGGN